VVSSITGVSNPEPLNKTSVLPEDKLRWCSVPLSEVLGRQNRLEASVFDVDARHARELLERSPWDIVPLWSAEGLVAQAYYPERFKRIYVDAKHGIPFFLPSQIVEVNPSAEKFISEKTKCNMDALALKKDMFLLTRSGTIGHSTIVTETLEGKVFSDDVIRITFREQEDLGYVYAFFHTKTGQTLLSTNQYGAVISHIEPEHLKNVLVPNAPESVKKEIHELAMRSFQLRDESNQMLRNAEDMMKEALKLPALDRMEQELFDGSAGMLNFSVKLSELAGRFDASYHNSLADAIIKKLHHYAREVTVVGDPRISKQIILPGRFKRVYVEEGQGVRLIGGRELFEFSPSSDKFLSREQHKEQIRKELAIRENAIITTSRGTLGKVMLAPKHFEGWAISDNLIQIVPAQRENIGYIYVFLNSEYGYELIRRFTYGGVVDALEVEHVKQIPVPLLKDEEIQLKINELALQANNKRYEAYLLEQQAIQAVNEKVLQI
jgi:type I restriction enzyme S subunit